MSYEDILVSDGDIGFVGFASRPDPMTLPAGVCRLARNKRFVRGRAETRRGLKRLASEINIAQVPLLIPFDLGNDKTITALTEAAGTATATIVGHGYSSGQQLSVRDAVENEYNGDHLITVVDADTFTFAVSGSPSSPATGTILANDGPVVRTNYSGGLFDACLFNSPVFDPGKEYIAICGTDALWLWTDGSTASQKSFPAGEVVADSDAVTMFQGFDRLYILREAPMTGLFAEQTVTSVTRSTTTATVTKAAHGFSTGNRVKFSGADQAAYNYEFDITVVDPDTFTFTVAHDPATPATGTITMRKVKPPLVWDGVSASVVVAPGGSSAVGATFSRMPSSSVAAYFNNQVIICPTPARDVVLVSDVLDPDTYDPMLKSFRPNAGSSDYIVSLHPYTDREILVLMRNSIYRARIILNLAGTDVSAEESEILLLTDEIGCVAKDSVVTAGSYIYFLSDSGVYRLESTFADLKLRGMNVPLSDAISDQFDDVNWEVAPLSSAVWFDNRYWITLPFGDTDRPNGLLVYNALNDAWESRDQYPVQISRLVVSKYYGRRRLFGVTRSGSLNLLDEQDLADDVGTGSVDIAGELITRRYTMGSGLPKRWIRSLVSVNMTQAAQVQTSILTYEPDRELLLGTTQTNGGPEDIMQKLSARVQGASAEVRILDITGRSTIRTVALEATQPRPQMTTREVR